MLEKDHMKVLEVFDVGELVNLNCGTNKSDSKIGNLKEFGNN